MSNEIVTGLLGWPVEHSLSPAIHHYWRKQHGIAGSYELFPTPPEKLGQTVAALKARGVRGFNITVPHKQAILPLIGPLDMRARAIGAVNTVIIEDGLLFGTNTDAFGFLANLRESMGELTPYMKHAVVLGAGGAARAILVALKEAGAKDILLTNRTQASAEKMAAEFGATAIPWEKRATCLEGATLLVNTTSLGMRHQPPLDMPLDGLAKEALVTDIVYAPLETELLRAARARGNPTVDGIGMLLYQAAAAFQLWHGVIPEVTQELRDAVARMGS